MFKKQDTILVRKEGDPLLPKGILNKEFLETQKRQAGMYYFNALYQGEPTSEGSGYFKIEMFNYYTELNKDISYKLISVDCAEETKAQSDYSCMQYWIESRKGFYLVDSVRGKWKFPELEKQVILFCNKILAHKVVIEAKSNGTALYQNLKQKTKLPVHQEKPTLNKEERVNQILGQFESGNVYFPEKAKWLFDYTKELLDFPIGEHDDQVDATTQALQYLTFKKKIFNIRMV
jgi:predicted phage terminase large subunit-like protein